MKRQHAKLLRAMIEYDAGDVQRIQHLLKVHNLAATIGTLEKMDEEDLFILESAAIVHDIGIHLSEQKYGSSEASGTGGAGRSPKTTGTDWRIYSGTNRTHLLAGRTSSYLQEHH